MDLSRPYTCVSPTLEGEVLVTLCRTTRPLTGGDVARLVRRGTRPGVQRALHRLVAQGLVQVLPAGRANLYTLNRGHLAYPAVEIIAGLRSNLLERLGKAIRKWKTAPLHASIFGSAARGDGGIASDIDVLVIRPGHLEEEHRVWRAQVDGLKDAIARWTGNRASIAEISASSLGSLRRRSSFAKDLRTDAVLLAGRPIRDLLEGRR